MLARVSRLFRPSRPEPHGQPGVPSTGRWIEESWTEAHDHHGIPSTGRGTGAPWTKTHADPRFQASLEPGRDALPGLQRGRAGPDAAIAQLAGAQRGLVTRRQLAALGVTRGAIEHRLARGRLHRVHRGVYLVGHGVAPAGAVILAAVLACGPGAVGSHVTAAVWWRIWPRWVRARWEPPGGMRPRSTGQAPNPALHVTLPGRRCRREGIRAHFVPALDRRDVAVKDGVPVTAPARTLIDCSATASRPEIEALVNEARVLRLVTDESLQAALSRAGSRRGAAGLADVLAAESGPSITRSEAERRLLRLVAAAGLPRPETNVHIGRHIVDALWRAPRLIVEVDGFAFHGSRAAFERDRRRDADLAAQGWRVIRVTWRQLVEQPHAVIARLAQALATRPVAG